MHYNWFKQDIENAWSHHLVKEFYKIQADIWNNSQKQLKLPNFKINPSLHHAWGMWHKNTRTITISLDLLRKFEWNAVIHVLKHEIAHQIVDEILNIESTPHGEPWKLACTMVGIPPNRCDSQANLESFKGNLPINPTIDKIRKLIIHGNDTNISQEESQTFLNKAHELMIQYNIDHNAIHGIGGIEGIEHNNTFYIFRPVGPLVDGHKSWLGNIATLVCDFYNVSCIWLPAPNNKKRIEFFGTPDNLDIAEYVFHALITQANSLWNTFKNVHQTQLNRLRAEHLTQPKPIDFTNLFHGMPHEELLDAQKYLTQALEIAKQPKLVYYPQYHRISKKAFMRGLVNGYRSKLQKEKQIIFDTIQPQDKALIHKANVLLRKEFEDHYNPHTISYGRSRGAGYNDGHKAGSTLTLAQGINSNGNRQLQLS